MKTLLDILSLFFLYIGVLGGWFFLIGFIDHYIRMDKAGRFDK